MKNSLREKLKEERVDIERKILAYHKSERKGKEDKAIAACKNKRVDPIIGKNAEAISNNGDMAESIGEQYETTWSEPIEPLGDAEEMFPEGEETDEAAEKDTIMDIDFSINNIKDAMGELDETSASGPDQFSSIILKKCREYLAEPFYLIRRISLDRSEIAEIYKIANVAPIHKGGSKGEA